MTKKGITQKQRLATIFASFSILAMGTASLFKSMSLDYYSVLGTLDKVIPAAIVLGGLGWVMGMIIERPRRRYSVGHNSLFINNMIKNEIDEPAQFVAEESLSEGLEPVE